MIKFKKDSYGYIILKLIALCGEFPYNSTYLIDLNERIIKRTLLNMKKEGYVTIIGTGKLKTIRITKKAFEPLKEIGEEYLSHYLSITDNHHFRGGVKNKNADMVVYRRHRLAEIMCMLISINTKIWTHEKPKLVLDKSNPTLISEDDLIFYTSKEMKNADIEQRYKTEFTRIMGVLLSPGGIYGIYNVNNGVMKWNRQGEGKAQVLIEDIVSYNCSNQYSSLDSAIMFGKEVHTAIDILNSNGGKRDINDFEMLSFDNTYTNIYYLTLDENGLYQLNLIIQKNWYNAIRNSIFPSSFLSTDYLSIDCDAYDKKNEKYIIMFLDGNIGRLKRFKEASYDDKNKKFEVVCFDWQEEMLREYLNSNTTLMVVTMERLSQLITETYS